MRESQFTVEEWLASNQQEMISCPYQPGNLMISKSACFKRHMVGRREKLNDLMKGDFFHYTFKKGLSLCRDCPIGQKLVFSKPMS